MPDAGNGATPIRTLLVANRGEIARRIFRTARAMGIRTVAVYSDADASAPHVREADAAVRLGPAPAAESYLLGDRVIEAAKASGADAIHPGYGFLSENSGFARAVIDAGLVWVGPPPEAIEAMGLKDAAKRLMERANVPIVPGFHGEAQDDATLRAEAERIGAPLLVKAAAGGGGKGMRLVEDLAEFGEAVASAKREARSAFGDDRVLIERFVTSPRHIEVQVLADAHGTTLALGTRGCSLQRRHQKVIEEAPAPGLTPAIESAVLDAARRAAEAVGYVNAGTIEFIADGAVLRAALEAESEEVPDGAFAFMEMNTRLQVEHPVTEIVTGIDLVEWQLRVAGGERLPDWMAGPVAATVPTRKPGHAAPFHAVEARLYAEDAGAGFLPATGTLHRLRLPGGDAILPDYDRYSGDGWVRTDAGVGEGDAITANYDPMIAKIIGVGAGRERAIDALADALAATEIAGTVTNIAFLRRLVDDPDFRAGTMDTGLIPRRGEALTSEPEPDAVAWGLAAMASGGMLAPPPRAGFRLWGRARSYVDMEQGGDRVAVCVVGPDPAGAYEVEAGDARGTFRLDGVEREDGGAGEGVEMFSVDVLAYDTADPGTTSPAAHDPGADGSSPYRVDGSPGGLRPSTRTRRTVVVHPGARSGERGVTVIGRGARSDTHAFTIPDPLAGGDGAAAAGDTVLAPMPGTVIALDVGVGDAVEAGQRLVVLEAMKMEHALKAPRAGTVASVAANVGGQVGAGDALVTLESE